MSDLHSSKEAAGEHENPDESSETLAALDALEGRGVRVLSEDGESCPIMVGEFEAAAGALFAAWPRGDSGPAPSAGFTDRLERFVLSQVAGDPRLAGEGHGQVPSDVDAEAPTLLTSGSTSGSQLRSIGGGAGSGRSFGLWGAAGWLAAAGLLAYVLLGANGADPESRSLGDRFDRFVAEGHAVQPWQSTSPDAEVLGGVVWDDKINTGFMKIAGLAPNDPEIEQYQLWIFRGDDPAAEAFPVDGGVFDVPSEGEVIIPIDAKLRVGHASIFAVTVEPPGGVVVSDRSSLPMLAKNTS